MRAKLVGEPLNEKFSSAENALRIDVRWTIKARDLSEVKPLYITPRIKSYLEKVKSVSYYVLDQKLTTGIPGKLQERIFICKGIDGETYLVNPEGFSYPRGVAHLVIPTDGQINDELDEQFNEPNTSFGSHYPLNAANYFESSEGDNSFMGMTGDELECDVCGRQLLPKHLVDGICPKCKDQKFWKDNQDHVHHGDDQDKNIPTY